MTDELTSADESGGPRADVPPEMVDRLVELGAPASMARAPIYQTLASQPDLLRGWIELSWGMRMREGAARRLREIVIVRMGILVGSPFVREAHEGFAREAGVTEAEIAALVEWRASDEFTRSERAALALADEMHGVSVSDEVLAELDRHFSAEEKVELIVTCGFYEMVPRVNNAVRAG